MWLLTIDHRGWTGWLIYSLVRLNKSLSANYSNSSSSVFCVEGIFVVLTLTSSDSSKPSKIIKLWSSVKIISMNKTCRYHKPSLPRSYFSSIILNPIQRSHHRLFLSKGTGAIPTSGLASKNKLSLQLSVSFAAAATADDKLSEKQLLACKNTLCLFCWANGCWASRVQIFHISAAVKWLYWTWQMSRTVEALQSKKINK